MLTPHTDIKEQYAGVCIFSMVLEPLKIYTIIFSKTLCRANKKKETSSSQYLSSNTFSLCYKHLLVRIILI